jgi:hypothetical protein
MRFGSDKIFVKYPAVNAAWQHRKRVFLFYLKYSMLSGAKPDKLLEIVDL